MHQSPAASFRPRTGASRQPWQPTLRALVLGMALIIGGHAALTAAEPAMATTFQADGVVLAGATRIGMNTNGEITVTGTGGSNGFHLSIIRTSDQRWLCGANLVDRRIDIDAAGRAVTMHGGIPLADGHSSIPITWGYQVMANGALRIASKIGSDAARAGQVTVTVPLHSRRSLHAGRSVTVDGQEFLVQPIDGTEMRVIPLWKGSPQQVSFACGLPGQFTLTPRTVGTVSITDRRIADRPGGGVIDISSEMSNGEMVLDLTLESLVATRSGEMRAGIDFGALRLPHPYQANLLSNPGFEQGLRFWDKLTLGLDGIQSTTINDFFHVSDRDAHEGHRCLEILTEPGVMPVHIACHAIPVEAGKPYVFSFWAKADHDGCVLDVGSHTAEWPKFAGGGELKMHRDWTRHQFHFIAPNRLVSLGFAPSARNPAGARILVDAVQLEAGSEPTAFVTRPATATVITAEHGNLLLPGEAVHAAVRVAGVPGTSGTIDLRASGIDASERHHDQLAFTLDQEGVALLPLPWAEQLPRGMTVIETNLATAAGYRDQEFHRIAIAPQPDPHRRHQQLFAGGAFDSRYGNWPRWATFFERAGIGAHVMFDPAPEAMRAAFASHGVYFYSAIFDGGENVTLNGEKIELRKRYFDLTPAQLTAIEELAFAKAKANPAIRHWKTFNEVDAGSSGIPLLAGADRDARMHAFVALHAAAYRGIKRADPAMLVMTPDCSSMYPSTGIALIDAYFAAGGKAYSDIAAMHSYRARPEDPDFDIDFGKFLAVLDRHGFKGDIWFTEGIYHQPWHVPALGLDPHAGCSSDHFRMSSLSYDCAWGERIATAYTMRTWLLMLKHSDRVKNSVDWGFPRNDRTLDHDFTPSTLFFASNTLADLLGDSTWLRDVEYGQGIRCQIYDDGHGGTVAALWSCDAERDRGNGASPLLHLPGLPASERIAMDGGPLATMADLPIGPEPQFLRSRDRAALIAALEAGSFPAGGIAQVHSGLRLIAADRAEASVKNLLGRPQHGRLVVTSGSHQLYDAEVELAAHATITVPVPVTLIPGTLAPVAAEIGFTPSGAPAVAPLAQAFDTFPIRKATKALTIDGDLSDWPDSSRIAIPHRLVEYTPLTADEREKFPNPKPWQGPADLSAAFRAAWDERNLYLAVEVHDDIHNPIDDPSRSWQGDGLQLYFDAWGDARSRGLKGYGNDDQSMRLWARADGSVSVLRDSAPEQQVAFLRTGPVTGMQAVCKRRDDGVTIYEMALPLREIQPLTLTTGTVFGFALLINDRDQDWRKRALTMTPPGTEPHQHPELYPAAMLTE